jgi:glycosyltransferase involved in cell wall biosynthesis
MTICTKGLSPHVSVIIPTYNHGRFLAESVNSVLGQTFQDLECIIVDDGSSDETDQVLAAFSDQRLVYASTPRLGVSGARNRGLDLSRGSLIAFLDADDRWRPDKLERQVAILADDSEVDMVFTNFVRFTSAGKWLPDQFMYVPELDRIPSRKAADGGVLIEGNPFDFLITSRELAAWIPTIIVRRAVTEGIRFPLGISVCEDLHYILNVAWRSRVLAYLPESQVEVRRHGENTYEAKDVPENLVLVLRMLEKDAPFVGKPAFRLRFGKELALLGSRLAYQGEFTRAVAALGDSLRFRESRPIALKACIAFPVRWLMGLLRLSI